jgi:hypothetical protein
MADRLVHSGLPLFAASDVPGLAPVKLFGASAGIKTVVACATTTEEPIGFTGQVGAVGGQAISVYKPQDIAQGVAGATILSGADVGLAGATTAVGASGSFSQPLHGPVSGASGSVVWRAGKALAPANPGDVFTYLFSPRQLSGLA